MNKVFEKIIEKLEELHERYINQYGAVGGNPMAFSVKECMEIVKQGCVSDDVCEWRLCNEEANVYDTSCRNPHILIEGTPKENNYEYCPYCGKRIKVVN